MIPMDIIGVTAQLKSDTMENICKHHALHLKSMQGADEPLTETGTSNWASLYKAAGVSAVAIVVLVPIQMAVFLI